MLVAAVASGCGVTPVTSVADSAGSMIQGPMPVAAVHLISSASTHQQAAGRMATPGTQMAPAAILTMLLMCGAAQAEILSSNWQ